MDIRSDPRDDVYENLITPRVEILGRRELAETAIRRELVTVGAAGATGELVGLLPLARTLGVTVAEAQRLSGFARQTLYKVMKAEPGASFADSDTERLARLLIIAGVAAGAEQTLAALAAAMNVVPAALVAPARLLASLGLADLAPGEAPTLAATGRAVDWLRLLASSRELDDRATGYGIYLRVEEADLARIDAAVGEIVGLGEASLLPASTAPSVMVGPELALIIRAPDQRSALGAAEAIWTEIGARAGITGAMRVADLHPPVTWTNAPSATLDAFLDALVAGAEEEGAARLRGARERYEGGEPERILVGRCLTAAARELRRDLGNQGAAHSPQITGGDSAFEEWQIVQSPGLGSLTSRATAIRRPLLEALALAAERLGPFRGGELAAFRAPGERAAEPHAVAPSPDDLVEMGRLAGEAVAAGGGEERHLLAVMRTVTGDRD